MIQSIKNFHRTFYCANFYRSLILDWKGIGLGFLFLLSLLGGVQGSLSVDTVRKSFVEHAPALFDAMPKMSVDKGSLSATPPDRLLLTLYVDEELGEQKVLVDTTQSSKNDEAVKAAFEQKGTLVLIFSDGVVAKDQRSGKIRVEPIDPTVTKLVKHEDWVKFGQTFQSVIGGKTFIVCAFIALSLMMFVGRIILTVSGAIVLFIISPLFKVSLPFAASLRLASASQVPIGIISMVLTANGAVFVLIWFGFAVFGLLAARGLNRLA